MPTPVGKAAEDAPAPARTRAGTLALRRPAAFGALVALAAFTFGVAIAPLGQGAQRSAIAAALLAAALVAWQLAATRRRSDSVPAMPAPRYLRRDEAALAEATAMSQRGESEFRVIERGGGRLVLMGGFDLDYYHDVEIVFEDVFADDCPDELRWPRFADAGRLGDRRCFVIEDDEGRYEVVAAAVAAEFGKVFHYDRGSELQPGERIWARVRG